MSTGAARAIHKVAHLPRGAIPCVPREGNDVTPCNVRGFRQNDATPGNLPRFQVFTCTFSARSALPLPAPRAGRVLPWLQKSQIRGPILRIVFALQRGTNQDFPPLPVAPSKTRAARRVSGRRPNAPQCTPAPSKGCMVDRVARLLRGDAPGPPKPVAC